MKIKKVTLYFLGIIILSVLAGSFMINGSSISNENFRDNNGALGNGDIQKVVIGMKGYNYYPNTIKVKSGQPVSISLDDSVYGCFRDFTIKEFGIREYLRTPQDSVEFIPNRKGTFTFACSMGMGTGKLIVE